MPNWCYTDVTIWTDSEHADEIERLYAVLEELSGHESRLKNDFGSLWYGNILDYHGMYSKKIRCRGQIISYGELEEDEGTGDIYFQLMSEDAWYVQTEFYKTLLKKYPHLHWVYLAEEPGMEIYDNADASGRFYPEKYILDYAPDKGAWIFEYSTDLDGLLEYASKLFGRMFANLDEFTAFAETIPENDRLMIHKYESVAI